MVKLTAISIGAVEVRVKVFAFLRPVVGGNVVFLKKFVISMCKRAFGIILALAHFPVPTNFGLKFLLEVLSGGSYPFGFDSFDF